MADPPVLTLAVQRGPREGEKLQCRAGAVFRVGRVARGNTLAVRDPGASQRHLALEFLPPPTSRWAVSDLESSNGTFLNGAPVAPSRPAPLSDGDLIKIGESTVLAVSLSSSAPNPEKNPALRSSSRHVAPVEDEEEQEAAVVTRRGARKKAVDAPLPPPAPRTRSARVAARRGEAVGSGQEDEGEKTGRGGRRMVPRASTGKVREDDLEEEEEKEDKMVAAVAAATRRGRSRRPPRARAAKGVAEREEERVVNEDKENRVAVGGGEVEKTVKELEKEAPVTRRGRSRRLQKATDNAQSAAAKGGDEEEEGKALCGEEGNNTGVELGERIVQESEPKAERGVASDGRDEGDGKQVEGNGGDDMENMTLREWFERMEKFLPAMINEAAEEMMAALREKHRCIDEYLMTLGSRSDAA